MMEQMIKDNQLTFKSLEKDIYRFICTFGQDLTKQILETYDQRLKKDETRHLIETRVSGQRRSKRSMVK